MKAGGEEQARSARASVASEAHTRRKRLGDGGERLAATWLEAHGYRIIGRNWRCPYGEIDVIAETATSTGDEIVFVEVKTRRGEASGAPEEAITRGKRRRLILAAQSYLAERGEEQRAHRIDVVAVDLSGTGTLRQVRHYPRCIEAED